MAKTFTLEEANARIPELEQLFEELQLTREKLVAKGPSLEAVLQQAGHNGGNKKAGEYLLLLQRFQAAFQMIQEIGVEIKDLNLGLVDFPSIRDGNLVYLCWKRGEPRIEFWHELDTGFAGRQPL